MRTTNEINFLSPSRRLQRRTSAFCGSLMVLLLLATMATPAAAHEFGPFAIDRYAALRVAPNEIELDYVLGFAETPTQADGDTIEADPAAYCATRLADIEVSVDGAPVALSAASATTLREDGDGGLTTLRLTCNWTAPIDESADARSLRFDDASFSGRVGWREVVVVGDRTSVTGDVSSDSITERLTDFPDPDDNPETRTVEFDFAASDDVGGAELDDTEPGDNEGGDPFSNLIADADGGLGSMIIAIGFAAVLGALHSLAPGHGKTLIGAYLVGTKGTKIQALVLAIAVALSHTLGVLILGTITYIAGAAFAPERVYPWLQGLSAVIVLGIGIWLVVTAYREFKQRVAAAEAAPAPAPATAALATVGAAGAAPVIAPGHHDHGDHSHGDHSHDHGHSDHSHDHGDHSHDHGHHSHDHPHDDHSHDHHDHDDHHDHGHDHDHGSGWHRHGIFPHTHRYDLDELDLSGKVSWKTLAVLGLSGGIVPSTSAIIVLLGAIQLNRIAFGGVLILSFGLGMAIALVAVGLGMVALRDRAYGAMDGNAIIRQSRIWIVPIAAGAVFVIGCFLVVRALFEIGAL